MGGGGMESIKYLPDIKIISIFICYFKIFLCQHCLLAVLNGKHY
jgi:hypothetical protein